MMRRIKTLLRRFSRFMMTLLNTTGYDDGKWCKTRTIYLALLESIKIADGGEKKISKDAIPSILQEALGSIVR